MFRVMILEQSTVFSNKQMSTISNRPKFKFFIYLFEKKITPFFFISNFLYFHAMISQNKSNTKLIMAFKHFTYGRLPFFCYFLGSRRHWFNKKFNLGGSFFTCLHNKRAKNQ